MEETLTVIMLDQIVHDNKHPYCEDVTCPCQAEREDTMSTHEQVTQANQEADALWSAVPAWPVDQDGNFVQDEAVLVFMTEIETEELPVIASK